MAKDDDFEKARDALRKRHEREIQERLDAEAAEEAALERAGEWSDKNTIDEIARLIGVDNINEVRDLSKYTDDPKVARAAENVVRYWKKNPKKAKRIAQQNKSGLRKAAKNKGGCLSTIIGLATLAGGIYATIKGIV